MRVVCRLLILAFRHWGIGREDIAFTGFWRNTDLVTRCPREALVSTWRRPNSAVLGIMNYGLDADGYEHTRPCEITLDLHALGVPAGTPPQSIRASAFINPPLNSRYLGHMKYYQDLPFEETPNGRSKLPPDFTPALDPVTGALTGFDLYYHHTRFVVITWDDQPAPDEFATPFPGELANRALDPTLHPRPARHPLAVRARFHRRSLAASRHRPDPRRLRR